MAEQVSGDTKKLRDVIEEANDLKESFKKAKDKVAEAIEEINKLAEKVEQPLSTSISETMFDTAPIDTMINGMTTEQEQLESYDEDKDSNILGIIWQGARNFAGGATQAAVGIGEGLLDGVANLGIDALQEISKKTGADTGKYQSAIAGFISKDFTSTATKFVGGENYDENSNAAKIGKLTGTLVTYHFIPGGSIVADAVVGAISGYGQDMQKNLRAGKTIEESQKDSISGALREAGVAIASNLVFNLGGKAFTKVADSSFGQSLSNSIKKSKVGKLIDKPLSAYKNYKFKKASNKLDKATKKLKTAEEGLKTATQKAEDAAEEGIGKKLTTKVGESWNKHRVNSAQNRVALAEEEKFRRAISAGKTDKAIDIAAKRADDLKKSAADASDTFKTEGTKKAEKASKKLEDKVNSLDDDITRVSESSQLKKDVSAAEDRVTKANTNMTDAAKKLSDEQKVANEAVEQAEKSAKKAKETFKANEEQLTKFNDTYETAKIEAQRLTDEAGINPTDIQASAIENTNRKVERLGRTKQEAERIANESRTASANADETFAKAKEAAKKENLSSYQRSVDAQKELDAATDDLTKLKAKQGDPDALKQQAKVNNKELVTKQTEAHAVQETAEDQVVQARKTFETKETEAAAANKHVDDVYDHGYTAVEKAQAKAAEADVAKAEAKSALDTAEDSLSKAKEAAKKADDALDDAISKDVFKAQQEIQENTSKILPSAKKIMKETQPITPIARAKYNHLGFGKYKNIGLANAIGLDDTVRDIISPSADNVLKSKDSDKNTESNTDNTDNKDDKTQNNDNGDNTQQYYPTSSTETGGSPGGGEASSSNDSSVPQYRDSSVSTQAPTTTMTSPPTTAAPTTAMTSPPTTAAPTTAMTSPPTTAVPTTAMTSPPTPAAPTATPITTAPSVTPSQTTTGGTYHTGGGYTGTGGYTENNTTLPTDGTTETTTGLDDIKDTLTDGTTSIEDVIKGSKYTKIPSTPSPVTTTSPSGGSSAVIPIAAGLSAAAAAGIGAKAYMDRKKNNDNGEDEDEFDTDEWSGDDSVDIQYDDSSDNENYLDTDDDYTYQTADNSEKYDARSSDELADLQ